MSPAGGALSAGTQATGTHAIGAAEISLVFDQATVDLDALQRSAYAVAAEMTVDIRISGADYVCTLFPRTQDTIAKETEPLRNLVFALAFSQTGLVEAEASE